MSWRDHPSLRKSVRWFVLGVVLLVVLDLVLLVLGTISQSVTAKNKSSEKAQALAEKIPTYFSILDASDRGFGATPSDRVLNGLRTALVALGAKYLGTGESLKIDVTDVDLAGRFDPMLHPDQVRVLRDADWPRISLHYVLKRNGDVVRQGDERITDMNYLRQQPPLQTGETAWVSWDTDDAFAFPAE